MTRWTFDPAHSTVSFSARHMMITTVRGTLGAVSGELEFDPDNPSASSVRAVIDATTINSGVADRDNHLKSPDFLDVANFPTITFVSKRVELKNNTEGKVYGDLTIRGTTREVVLDVELLGLEKDPFAGAERAGFSASTKLNREDFGLTWNVALETGGWLVGKEIKVELDVQLIKVVETATA